MCFFLFTNPSSMTYRFQDLPMGQRYTGYPKKNIILLKGKNDPSTGIPVPRLGHRWHLFDEGLPSWPRFCSNWRFLRPESCQLDAHSEVVGCFPGEWPLPKIFLGIGQRGFSKNVCRIMWNYFAKVMFLRQSTMVFFLVFLRVSF